MKNSISILEISLTSIYISRVRRALRNHKSREIKRKESDKGEHQLEGTRISSNEILKVEGEHYHKAAVFKSLIHRRCLRKLVLAATSDKIAIEETRAGEAWIEGTSSSST